MKGFVKVGLPRALKARDNYRGWLDTTETLIDDLIDKYYAQEYPKTFFFMRWLRRKETPKQFLAGNLGFFCSYDEELYKVATEEECREVRKWCYRHDTSPQSAAVRKLCSVSQDGFILVDQDVAGFIETWEAYK